MKSKITKTILLLAFIGLSFGKVNAQYVTIPDPNFVTWLTTNYPTCMTGNQMDTTCSSIVNQTGFFTISSINAQNLDGLQYFDNVTFLGIDNCLNLTSIPAIPQLVSTFWCFDNPVLTSITSFPAGLDTLSFDNNLAITSLPILPSGLKHLELRNNSIISLSDINLPNGLKYLDISNNLVPIDLQQGNTLPDSLQKLIAFGNFFYANNGTFPAHLKYFDGSYSTYIDQSFNVLFPSTLNYLNLSNSSLFCVNSQLPNSISTLNLSGNNFTCLPNYIPAMDAATLAMPLCITNDILNNPNGCSGAASGIVGKVFQDMNSNCTLDANENSIQNVRIKFYNPITNSFGIAYSATSGAYSFVTNTGTNIVLVDTLNKPFKANCPHPGIDSTVVTTSANPLAQNVNFDIACKNGFDVVVQSITHNGLVFPGQTHTLQVITGDASQWYGLICSAGTSGQVAITINGPVTFAGVPSGALTPSISGNVYTYTIADFGAINNQTAFKLLLTTETTAQSGNTVCVNANITTTSVDNDTVNNNSYLCYNVVNSYDPNYKEVYPTDVLPNYTDWFTYNVHFQNLGTAAAININVLDTLDSNLDEETFEVINYSHYNETTLQNHIINFKFPNIQLPDSASNPIGSNGFVQYRVKPKANMPLGTQIKNTAHIYFDYNPAVVTNTTTNHFTTLTDVSSLRGTKQSQMKCYPNPAKDNLFVESSKVKVQSSKLSITDVLGNEVISEVITSNRTEISIQPLVKGIYFVKCGNETMKFIKQ